MELIHIMHCREIAALLGSEQAKSLSWVNRVQLRVHLWTCWHCRRLARQIRWMAELARGLQTTVASDPEFESRILARISGGDR